MSLGLEKLVTPLPLIRKAGKKEKFILYGAVTVRIQCLFSRRGIFKQIKKKLTGKAGGPSRRRFLVRGVMETLWSGTTRL